MIPRKRLQLLLHVLQIFYVFGDGDPGSEGFRLDLADNLVDDVVQVTQSSSIVNGLNSSMTAADNRTDVFDPQDNLLVDSPNLLDDFADQTEAIIENLTVVNRTATSLTLAWKVIGPNDTEFTLNLYRDDVLLQSHTIQQLNYMFVNLSACTTYKIGVVPSTNLEAGMKFVQNETLFLEPGQVTDLQIDPSKPATLRLSWNIPESVTRCVKHYRLAIDSEAGSSESATANVTDYTFENLHACTTYYVTVTPVDLNETDGTPTRLKSPSTLKEVTTAPVLYENKTASVVVTKDSTSLIWLIENKRNNCTLFNVTTECQVNGSDGAGYELCNGNGYNDSSTLLSSRPNNVTVTVGTLSPYTRYLCRARIINEMGESDWSKDVELQTSEDTTSAPEQFQNIGRGSNNQLTFTWLAPKYRPGKLQTYRINFTWLPSYPVPPYQGCNANHKTSYVVDSIAADSYTQDLQDEEACAHYSARISAKTAAGYSPEAAIEFDSMSGGRPSEVIELKCKWKRRENDPGSLDTVLSWGLPCNSRGLLYQFVVSVLGTRGPDRENHSLSGVVDVPDNYGNNQTFVISFGELRPLYHYVFTVVATIRGGPAEPGDPKECIIDYPAGIPPQPKPDYIKSIRLDPHKAQRSTTSAAILLPLFPDDHGQIRYYAVMVSRRSFANSSARFDIVKESWPGVSSWKEAMEKNFDIVYQATEPRWQPSPTYVVDYGHMRAVKFVIGEDVTCPEVSSNSNTRSYCNGPLKPDVWYEVRMRAFTDHGYADSVAFSIKTNAELNVGLVLGAVFGILFIGILTTLMLLVRRCSFRLLIQRIAQSNIPESPVPNPLTRRKFLNHCQQLAENPEKLSNEFKLLQTLSVDLQMPSNAACLQANRKKNRYSDILPYDFSRVKLEIIDNDPNTDYINASFIRGYSSHEEYIACQGPKEETSHDFWRMIDQYDVKMIVMLTQLVERGREKCHQYFPAIRETFDYEKLTIKCTSELDYRTYTHRTLLLQKNDKKRTITHLHFKDWPDHDVPDDFDAMIQFCQMFRKQMTSLKGLSVIHCSAGIGRTGTLIAIDILLQCIRDNRKLDVFGTVYRLRRHRLNMVQRESQYTYIYNCIRQVLKNPYFLKSYKPPPIDPIYTKAKRKKDNYNSSPDIVDSLDTLRKNSLSASIDSLQPLCESSPQTTPKIPMNGLRYCKSTSAIDARSHINRIGRYNSEGYAICGSAVDSLSISSKESTDEINELESTTGSLYENVEPLIRPTSSQTIAGSNYYLTNDSGEKDTSL